MCILTVSHWLHYTSQCTRRSKAHRSLLPSHTQRPSLKLDGKTRYCGSRDGADAYLSIRVDENSALMSFFTSRAQPGTLSSHIPHFDTDLKTDFTPGSTQTRLRPRTLVEGI
jgi:hypothetical protein